MSATHFAEGTPWRLISGLESALASVSTISLIALYAVYVMVLLRIASLLQSILTLLQRTHGPSTPPPRAAKRSAAPAVSAKLAGRTLAGLCCFMLVWITLGPVVARMGARITNASEDELRRSLRGGRQSAEAAVASLREEIIQVPWAIITKHHAWPAVLATHHLGALLWSAAALAQFFLRRATLAQRARHRVVGRLFMAAAGLLTAGFVLIATNGLHAYNDFHALWPADVPARAWYFAAIDAVEWAAQAWFVLTAGLAWRAARARKYDRHRVWIVRHMASGLWVAMMRALMIPVGHALLRILGLRSTGFRKMVVFYGAAVAGMVVCGAGAELYLRGSEPPAAEEGEEGGSSKDD